MTTQRSLSHRLARFFSVLLMSAALTAHAGTDLHSTAPGVGGPDGMCDVWQAIYNAWGISASADADNDGCNNQVESIAGTDPFKGGDCLRVGNTVISATTVTFFFDAEAGKKYRVLSDPSLTANPYGTTETHTLPVAGQTQFVPAADNPAAFITVTKASGARRFYKLEVSDADSDTDGVSNWAEIRTGLNPNLADSDSDGTSDADEIEAEVTVDDVVSIVSTVTSASEDGPSAGQFTIQRTRSLIPATVNFSISGTATAPSDYSASPATSVSFGSGEKSKPVYVNPEADANVEGSESVTAMLTTTSAGSYAPPAIDPDHDTATVIIGNTTAATGTGLLARYYDHSSSTYVHAANFGDSANYQYTRTGTTTFTGSAVITPTGVSPARLATLLAALTPNTTMVKFSFNGGNLNTSVYNHQNYLVTSKGAAAFTIALPPGAGLPASSESTCHFSIQPIHPGLIERLEVVNNDWIHGTPNANTISNMNVPENYSDTFETYLHPTTAGNYRFQLDADDRARVLIDLNLNGVFDLPGEQVVEHGWDTAATVSPEDGTADDEVIGTFKATPSDSPYVLAVPAGPAQRYKMRVEHVETTGDARCRLQWNINGGTFANIPQANQFTHTQAMTWSYTAGNLVVTPTGGHGFAVNDSAPLAFSSGPLFRPGVSSTQNGTLPITAVTATTFTVPIAPTTVSVTGAATTAGSTTVTVPSTTGLFIGMLVTGTGLPASEFITAIPSATSITVTTATGITTQVSTNLTCSAGGIPVTITGATTTAGSRTVLVPNIDGLATGMAITGLGLPTNATISAIGPGMIFLSTATGVTAQANTTLTAFLPATGSVTGNGFLLTNSASATLGAYVGTGATTGAFNQIYTNTSFSGSPARVGVDGNGTNGAVTAQNNGVWGSGTPDVALINPDTFSIRWAGQVQPQFTEEYTFVVHADDGCTFRFNGQVQEMKTLPGTNNDGSTYHYDSTTGTILVNYANARVKAGSFVAGETIRIDPSSGNLNQTTANTYTYDAASGVATVNYSAQTTVTPGGYQPGQVVELDPTAGTASALANARYTILASPAPTTTTFAVDFGINAFASETAGTAGINVTDNRDIVVASVFPAGNATYTYNSADGVTVVDYSAAGLPANTLTAGMQVVLDPTGGNLTNEIYTYKTITAHTATTFTVGYATGLGNSTSTMLFMAPSLTSLSGSLTTAMALTHYPGRNANNSVGNINLEIVNKGLKEWSSMGNERYVRVPVVGGTRYDIQLDYYEATGYARAQLYWFSPSQPKQIIPAERLYPPTVAQAPAAHVSDMTANALVGGPFTHTILGSNGGAISISGAPAWLTLTGDVLSGTPPTGSGGDYQILITITNANGTSTSVLNLHVDASGGTVARELWTGITGTSLSSIPLGTAPSSTANLTSLQAPTSAADDFGARIRGYITAPVTGNYYFWLSASDTAEFWLSNDAEVVNAFKRASVTGGGTTPQNWATAAKSSWMALEAGKRYYFEILHKSGIGDDHLALGWSKPGEATTVPSGIVPDFVISPYVAPAPGSSNGTLYIATLLAQNGAVGLTPGSKPKGVGSATFRLSEDENSAIVTYSYGGLTGMLTDWHIHNDAFLSYPSSIMYDPNAPPAGSGPLPDNNPPGLTSHKWVIPATVGPMTKAQVVELIKQGKAYINLHTALNPNGEIRGNFTLANGTRTFTPPPPPLMWTDDSATNAGAARFLAQASYGASVTDIKDLKALTATGGVSGERPASRYETWIDNQFALTPSQQLPEVLAKEFSDANGGAQFDETLTFNSWWRNSITGSDQLRQRVAYALSQILVVSAQGPLDNRADALSYYYDKLAADAFGNFRTILEDVTLTPAMGRYLDMRNNDKPDPSVGRIPNENYAREIKQLFSIGLYRHWPDGSLILTSKDSPIDTYTQREIVGLSHVFTGWTDGYDGPYRTSLSAPTNWIRQMREVPARHYTGTKRLLNNEVFPGLPTLGGQPLDPIATHNSTHFNQSAYQNLAVQEMDASHDQIFNHPNVGPFICRQLIQRLVTSHPSRDYLFRVVQKFNDRGDGVRGDMQAVIKAILLDFEARDTAIANVPAYGKQREPVLRVAAAGRAFRMDGTSGTWVQPSTTQPTAGAHVIEINTASMNPKLVGGRSIFLEFTGGSWAAGDTTPSDGIYTVLSTPAPTTTAPFKFYVNARGWVGVSTSNGVTNNGISGTYSSAANSTTATITLSGHWLPAGGSAYLDFELPTGTAIADGVYTAVTSDSTTGGGSVFTITVPTNAAARSGRVRMVGFRGSYTVSNSGLASPQDKRITFDTTDWITTIIADHHLTVGQQVFQNFTAGNPQPTDGVFTVESVPDSNTFTVLTSAAIATQGGANDADNGMWMFPLVTQPVSRSGSTPGSVLGQPSTFNMGSTDTEMDQSPINADTVFNFFLPDYKFPGLLASQGITTPEFQITAETSVIRQANFIYNGLFNPGDTNGLASFKSGSHALVLDYSAWFGNAVGTPGTVGEVLGAGTTTTVPWTNNQNIPDLIDRLNTLLAGGRLTANAKTIIQNFVTYDRTISSIPVSNPCSITTSTAHGLTTGDTVVISGVGGGTFRNVADTAAATINATFTITVTSTTTFTLNNDIRCTVAPSAANLTNARVNFITYNNTTPTDTQKRDRLRAILHFILTSPDFTIQR